MKAMRERKKRDWKEIVGVILFVTLVGSTVYAIFKIFTSSPGSAAAENYAYLRSDYVLMLLQCCLGLTVMLLPTALEKRWSMRIPNYMTIMYFIFLYCGIFLGEIERFFYIVPFWDDILHSFSACMLGAFAFSLVSVLNASQRTKVTLSPFFVAMFAFSFALAIGALWEIYEYGCDVALGLNMQKYRLMDGTVLAGMAALADTMKDLIVDAVSAFAISAIGYFSIKNGSGSTVHKRNNGAAQVKNDFATGKQLK